MKRYECKRCGATFQTEKALKQHVKAKHSSYYYTSRTIPLLILVMAIVVMVSLYAQLQMLSSNSDEDTDILSGYLSGHEKLAMHIHVMLKIYVDDEELKIPAGIGILPDGRMRYIHTHDPTGTIHIEAQFTHSFKLGDFFKIWGKELSSVCFDNYCGKVFVTINGEPYDGDPNEIILKDGDKIVINVTTSTAKKVIKLINVK